MSTASNQSGNGSSTTLKRTPHTLPLIARPPLQSKSKPITPEWADQSDDNGEYAEHRVRNYYITYGVCPPEFPEGFRRSSGSIYDNTKDVLDSKCSKVAVMHYNPKGTPRWKENGKVRQEYLISRRDEYDDAMMGDDKSSIATTWEEVLEDVGAGATASNTDTGDQGDQDERDEDQRGEDQRGEDQRDENKGDAPNADMEQGEDEAGDHQTTAVATDTNDYNGLLPRLRDWASAHDGVDEGSLDTEDFATMAREIDADIGRKISHEIVRIGDMLWGWVGDRKLEQHFDRAETKRMAWVLIVEKTKEAEPSAHE